MVEAGQSSPRVATTELGMRSAVAFEEEDPLRSSSRMGLVQASDRPGQRRWDADEAEGEIGVASDDEEVLRST